MARSLMEESVALSREVGDKWMLAVALCDLAQVVWAQGNALSARVLLEEGLTLTQELGGKWGETRFFSILAAWARAQGDYAQAAAHYQEAFSVAQQTGDMQIIGESLAGLGDMVRRQGDNAKALELYNQGLTIARELGSQFSTSWLLCGLGDIARDEGNSTRAAALYSEGLSLAMNDDYNKLGVGRCLLGLARIARSSQQFWRAAQLLCATEAQLNIDRDLDPLDRAEYERDVAVIRVHLGEEAFTSAWAAGQTTPLEQVISNVLKMSG
jgi:tetratricopeptide (TPR) repeat protein